MVCKACGKETEIDTALCPSCKSKTEDRDALTPNEDNEVVISISAKEELPYENEYDSCVSNEQPRKKVLIWCVIGVAFLFILFFSFASVSVKLFYSSSDSVFSGYGILECMDGTLGTAARMVVLLIITGIAMIITGVARYKTKKYEKLISSTMIVESLISIVSSTVSYVNISSVLSEFDSAFSTVNVGVGVYLSIGLSILSFIMAISINRECQRA